MNNHDHVHKDYDDVDLSEVVGLINGAVDYDWNNLNSPCLQPLHIADDCYNVIMVIKITKKTMTMI